AGGEGVEKDFKRAFMYYMRAAGLRNRAGTTSAGDMMLNGLGTPPNFQLGVKYLLASYHAGSGRAPYILGLYFAKKGNLPEAEKWWGRTIKTGIAPWSQNAMMKLGVLLVQNVKSPKGQAAGFALIHRAAAAGLALAEYDTGLLYLNGEGTAKNRAKAIMWLEKAAATKGIIGAKAEKVLSALRSGAPVNKH
ncbi:MAG: tetratricopeptide repeat protein, partial [Phycisphaerae bacterium]